MRRIFPSKHSSSSSGSNNNSSSSSGAALKPPAAKKEKSSVEKDGAKPRGGSQQRQQQVVKQGCSQDFPSRVRQREHWCPSCPSGTELRCETPPSGDENVSVVVGREACRSSSSGRRQAISHTRLGLPEECQDKQVLRPSIRAMSRSPSPDRGFEWTSGLQEALDQLVAESRDELGPRKYVSEPPSPSSSPPAVIIEKRRRRENSTQDRPVSAGSDRSHRQSSLSLFPALEESHHALDASRGEASTTSHSMDFESRNSFASSTSRLSRSLSRSSNDGPSIMSNPRSQSFSDWSRGTTSDNFSHQQQEYSADDDLRDRSNFKYLSARAVAERLAKAIRGNLGNSSKPKEPKRPPPFPHTPTRSYESASNQNSTNKVSRQFARALEPTRPLSDAGSRATVMAEQAELSKHDRDAFLKQLDSRKSEISFVYENLDDRVLAAERLVAQAEAEATEVAYMTGKPRSKGDVERSDALTRQIRKLQKERRELAREVAAEVRLRSMERMTVREVLEFMKRDTELSINSLERDKMELRARLDQAVEADRCGDEGWLRERVKKLAGEKEWLEKELTTVTTKESALRQKVREFELQMQAHVARVEDAERTIVDLRESVVTGQKKLSQWEQEGERLRSNCREKEKETADLRKLVGRLQQLCTEREKSIQGLWQTLRTVSHDKSDQKAAKLQQEILRLSEVEHSLRNELDETRSRANRGEEQTVQSKDQTAALRERVQILGDKLRRQQEDMKALEKQNKQLREKLEQSDDSGAEVEVVENLPSKVVDEGSNLDVGKEKVIEGLQKSLSDMTHALNTQSERIQRLTGRNEELYRLYTAKERELLELQARLRDGGCNQAEAAKQVQDKMKRLQDEFHSQQAHCKALREKLAAKELEIEHIQGEVGGGHLLNEELSRLQNLLDAASKRISQLENQVKEKEHKLGMVQAQAKQYEHEVARCKAEMEKLVQERNETKEEAELMGREALRSGAEAEVLKRRVHQLEEDVLLKEGQLSILRNSLDNEDV